MLRSSLVPEKRTSRQSELLIDLRPGEGPLHAQIEQALREAARTGRLPAGTPLPSSRTLARDLGVSRGVVVEAYEQLAAEGYVEPRAGSRTVIASGLQPPPPRLPQPIGDRPRFDFRPGLPDLAQFPRKEWGRAVRSVVGKLRPEQLGYGDPLGTEELRSALADYLGRVRGARCDPQRILVCTGVAQALFLVARALSGLGIRSIAVEDPSNPEQRRILAAGGLGSCGVPVDSGGLDVEALERTDLRAVVVSPAHQYPTGSVLAADRRRALLAWAERRSGFVVEDDYDAEYRYDRAPVGALQGLAPARVVYTGSASKILAPALRLAGRPAGARRATDRSETSCRSRNAVRRATGLRHLPPRRLPRSPPTPDAQPVPISPRRAPRGAAAVAPGVGSPRRGRRSSRDGHPAGGNRGGGPGDGSGGSVGASLPGT